MRAIIWAAAFSVCITTGALADSGETLRFAVIRGNEQIGTHTIEIRRRAEATDVSIATDVAVKMAFITVYRFEHTGSEEWSGSRLVSLHSVTNDDGTRHRLDVTAAADGLRVAADGKAERADPGIVPASLWNPALTRQSVILNTLDGSRMNVAVEDAGTERLSVRGRIEKARHYVIHGDLERQVWYDDAGRLVQVRFKAKDGSDVVYRLI